jgi:hypothetical protein
MRPLRQRRQEGARRWSRLAGIPWFRGTLTIFTVRSIRAPGDEHTNAPESFTATSKPRRPDQSQPSQGLCHFTNSGEGKQKIFWNAVGITCAQIRMRGDPEYDGCRAPDQQRAAQFRRGAWRFRSPVSSSFCPQMVET